MIRLFLIFLIVLTSHGFGQGTTCSLATNVNPGSFIAPALTGTGASQIDASASVWYRFVPTSNGNLSINSCGGGSDTRLWIWTGNCGSLNLIGANDDFSGCISSGTNSFASRVDNLILSAGNTYYFEWDNAWSSSGFSWNFSYTALPNNNDAGIIYLKNRFTKIPLNQANYGIPFGATIKNFSGSAISNVTLTTEIYELPNLVTPIQVLTSSPINLGVGAQQAVVSGTWYPNLSVSKNFFIKYIKTQTQLDGVTTNDVSSQNLSIDFNSYARDNNTYSNAFNWSTSSEYSQGVIYPVTGNDVLSAVQFYTQSASTTQEYYIEVYPVINNIIQTNPIYVSTNQISTGVGWQTHTLTNPIPLPSGNYLFSVHKNGTLPYPIGCDPSIFTTGKNYIRTNISGTWNTIESYSVNYAFMIRPKLGIEPAVDISYVSHQSPGGEYTKVHTRQSVTGNNLVLSACAKNTGTNNLFNVTMTVNVKNVATNSLIYSATSSGHNLISGQTDTFTVSNFNIQTLGNYSIEYLFNTVNDQIPSNNSYVTYFSRTKSEMSRVVGATGTIGIGNNLTSAYDNGIIGQTFTLGQLDYLDSVKISLAAGTPSNQPVRVDIYATDINGVPTGSPIISTSTYTTTSSNTISGATINLPISSGTFTLNPGTYFFGVIENAGNIKLQSSTNYFNSNRAFMKWNQNPNGANAWTPIEYFGYSVGIAINPIFKVCLPIQVSSTVTNASCGQNNGSIQLTTSGGTGLFTFNWSNASSNGALNNNLSPGNYTCQLYDANQCVAPQQNASITMVSTAVNSSISTLNHPLCNGASTGSVSILATGGNGQFTYAWTPNISNASFANNLSAGNYSCLITDGLGCSVVQQISITQPSAISANPTINSISCFGGNNGSLILNPTGGTSPYQYNWGGNLGTTNTISSLTAGTYNCQITDANNCPFNQGFQVSQPLPITSFISNISHVTCFGTNTGNATISASGGTGMITFQWNPNGTTGASINNVPAGTYSCLMNDANGCQQSTSVTILQPSVLSTSIATQNNVSCYGGSNGSAQIIGAGGVGPYSYAWTPYGGNAATANNLSAGTFTCEVSDANGCTSSQTVQINAPSPISVATSSITPATCGTNNGALNLMVNGGTGSYAYQWTPSVGTSANLSNLFAGNYNVTVSDQNGCTGTLSVGISNISGPTVSLVNQTAVTCYNGSNGSAQISAIGGTGLLSYSWSPGNPTGNGTASISNLSAGQYACQVSDVNGCVGTITLIITQPSAVSGTILSNVPANCFGSPTGQLIISANGGNSGYSYSWSPVSGNSNQLMNVPAGSYTCQITDQFGCQGTITGTVTQPTAMQIVLDTVISPSCSYSNNGVIAIHVTGGNGNYSYSWAPNASSSSSLVNVSNGNYLVTASDVLGCQVSQTISVSSQSNIQLNSSLNPIDCNGNMNGQITINPSNGIAPYQFSWSNSMTSNSINNLDNGIYSCLITDALGCEKSFTDTIFTMSNLNSLANGTSIVCDSSSNGLITITTSNGISPYNYTWINNSETSNSLQTVGPGSFEAIVTDALNCQDTVSFTIYLTDLNAASQTTAVTCPGGQTGSITISAQGGEAPYSYNWVDFTINDSIISGVGSGNYICSIVDQQGCSVTLQNIVYEPFPWTINSVIEPEIFGFDGSINLGVSGATPPYTYSWNSGPTSNDLTFIAGGIYIVTITDTQGCQLVDTFQVASEVNINEHMLGKTLIYPNPNNGHFHLSLERGNISAIYDAYGRSISYVVLDAHSPVKEIQMNQIVPGIYYLRVTEETGFEETIRFEIN